MNVRNNGHGEKVAKFNLVSTTAGIQLEMELTAEASFLKKQELKRLRPLPHPSHEKSQ